MLSTFYLTALINILAELATTLQARFQWIKLCHLAMLFFL
jgi:hypothetical protein